jgi:uncharacterized YccA/Bax inhibitor family protein
MKFNKKLVGALAGLALAVLAVLGYEKYAPIVNAAKAVAETQVADEAPVAAPDAGL